MNGLRRGALAPLTALLTAMLLMLSGCQWATEQFIVRQLQGRVDPRLTADQQPMRVLLCGTGTPQASDAGQACTLVAAGGRLFLFDAGENAARSLERLRVPMDALDKVFLTHLHSDHFNGLGPLVNYSWIWGRKWPVVVSGPPGTQALVSALASAYAQDIAFRHEHMPMLDPALAVAQGREIALKDGADTLRVYDEAGVTIDAVRVCHEPVEPAYGYVVRYGGKKVFISGDTKVCERCAEAMKDADLAVHEAYATHLTQDAIPIMRRLGMTHMAQLAALTPDYHADTLELARFAQRSGVKHLALTHLTPAPTNWLGRRLFVAGMADAYGGVLTLGYDGLLIEP